MSQTLFSASLLAELLPNLAVHNPDALPDNLHSLHLLTRSARAEMRTLRLELRPEGFERQTLPDLLQQLVEATRDLSVGHQTTSSPGTPPQRRAAVVHASARARPTMLH